MVSLSNHSVEASARILRQAQEDKAQKNNKKDLRNWPCIAERLLRTSLLTGE
jgi:hypothetical protein